MIDEKLYKEIKEYCILNNIENVEKEINRLLKIGFNYEKYGNSPFYKKQNIEENDIEVVEERVEKQEEIKEKPKKRVRIIKND